MARQLSIFIPFIIFLIALFSMYGCAGIRIFPDGGTAAASLSSYEALVSPGDYFVSRDRNDFSILLYREPSGGWTVGQSTGLSDVTEEDVSLDGKKFTRITGMASPFVPASMDMEYTGGLSLHADFSVDDVIENIEISKNGNKISG